MAYAATTITITAGATPVLLVPGSPLGSRRRQALLQNVTTPAGSLALIALGSASQAPTGAFQWTGTVALSLMANRGDNIYGGVVSSIVDQKISILMDLL